MGRFRFRVWVDEFKMMFYPVDTTSMFNLVGEKSHSLCGDRKPQRSLQYLESINAPIMLSTYLFDRNGREIYEGDIIKREYGTKLGEVDCDYGTVDFNGLAFKLINRYILVEGRALAGDNLLIADCHEEYFSDTETQWEVIGNIFENPELTQIKRYSY